MYFYVLLFFDEFHHRVYRAHFVAGTPPSVISSLSILAVFSSGEGTANLFQRLSLLPSIAQKVQESVANEKPAISRPAREARDILKALMGDENITVA
jgi:hypothetical protein